MIQHPLTVGYWQAVNAAGNLCLGANDLFGTCFLAMVGNQHAIVTTVNGYPEVMTDGEIEFAYNKMTGFVAADKLTDRGDSVVDMLQKWTAYGWPGDPTLKPLSWRPIMHSEIHATIDDYAGVYAWHMLPRGEDGQWDFTDDAVRNNVAGEGPHAMLIAGSQPGFKQMATWATIKTVSDEWVDRYTKDCFEVRHPKWTKPSTLIV